MSLATWMGFSGTLIGESCLDAVLSRASRDPPASSCRQLGGQKEGRHLAVVFAFGD